MKKFVDEITQLISEAQYAEISGGTTSSYNLKACLKVRGEMMKDIHTMPDRLLLLTSLDQLIIKWRWALIRHNSQEKRGCAYDVETGNTIKEREQT